ncbi:hypothetical protein [Leifsonia sp. fls2-241-R2A-40a]|uniref:hypothetical protein n=1 Tax=Leifsonia sp. fls2-241-R2A-40a TaxID=3040290 RepID=UPI00254FFDF0|nr:hypothetical protein [Leifsonia sp. fls2-241-R2A-40a]
MESWYTFAVISGGVGGALLGLIFVAVSIRIDVIAASIELRNRAAQTLGLFLVPVLVALALSLPDQTPVSVGLEIAFVAVAVAVVLQLLDCRARTERSGDRVARLLDVGAPRLVTCITLLVGALLAITGLAAGLYLVAAAVTIALVGGVISAWLFLTRVTGA